jgi:type II restriction/modification system DNA methylase subunit YeeA
MHTGALKKFAQQARRQLLEQVSTRMEQVLQSDSVEIREKEKAVKELQEQISQFSKQSVIDRVAYTWFNRFCALRYMDVNHYTPMGIVSPVEGFTQPEILQEAKQGVIDDFIKVDKQRVFALLNGQLPSTNPQQESYRLLLVGACNAYHAQMPFLFPKIEDYTELLMPDDLLSENSILHAVRSALHEDACRDVEVIGWLYQFYISERKDEVFAALKKGRKIEAEDIPAATQLFTPHWIVRYLVENSLGRLWMLNHPESKLVEQMDYYIRPEQQETDYLDTKSPEEIKLCDPACGSGHMLTFAFDLLYSIYAEQGYDPIQIPRLILEKNLYGIEIDGRAGALAAFALTMKALQRDRRFLSRKVKPNVCVLQNIEFTNSELEVYMEEVGRDLFTESLRTTLRQFEHADNYGSLIQPRLNYVDFIREQIKNKGIFENLLLYHTNQKVMQVLEQAEYLSHKYHVVVTNPPYMGIRNMNENLSAYIKEQYPDSKSDSYSVFIERNIIFIRNNGFVGMITIPNWMFLSSFELLRNRLLEYTSFISLIDNGRGVWGSDFGSCAFILNKGAHIDSIGKFKRLFKKQGEVNSNKSLNNHFFDNGRYPFYSVRPSDFKKIPGSPIVYWVSNRVREIFEKYPPLSNSAISVQGMITGNNDKYLRSWYEVANNKISFEIKSPDELDRKNAYWLPYNKGGPIRKWYGNQFYVADWRDEGKDFTRNRSTNSHLYFRPYISWSYITIGSVSARYFPRGFIWDVGGSGAFPNDNERLFVLLGTICSKPCLYFLNALNPTVSLQVENILALPIVELNEELDYQVDRIVKSLVRISKRDWDSYETSWNFNRSPMLPANAPSARLSENYAKLYRHWYDMTQEMRRLEIENNRIFAEAYDLRDGLSPDVRLEDITLTCNPHHRYGSEKSDDEIESLLLADTMREFISYAVGCMLGRYSLDKPGLILADTGETVRDYLAQVPDPSFAPDEDNVIPVLGGEWFEDDIAERFKDFLRITYGTENFDENLAFLEQSIGKDIRSYFVKDFYNEHVKMYKKRPIYWLFSSPYGSFNALIYMHRYRSDTISVLLNDYLRQYRDKLSAYKSHQEAIERSSDASQREKTKALKEIEQVNKVLAELKEYEDEILYPLATQQIEIDLDDGVLVNYNKFGMALKKVSGLSE